MSGKDDLGFGISMSLGLGIGFFGAVIINNIYDYSYPKTDKVQSGYVVPSRLEVELIDLDGNGEIETTLNYDGKRYLLRQSEGQVTIEEYKLK